MFPSPPWIWNQTQYGRPDPRPGLPDPHSPDPLSGANLRATAHSWKTHKAGGLDGWRTQEFQALDDVSFARLADLLNLPVLVSLFLLLLCIWSRMNPSRFPDLA